MDGDCTGNGRAWTRDGVHTIERHRGVRDTRGLRRTTDRDGDRGPPRLLTADGTQQTPRSRRRDRYPQQEGRWPEPSLVDPGADRPLTGRARTPSSGGTGSTARSLL